MGIDEPTMLRWKRAGSTKERSAHIVLPTNEMNDPKAGMNDATTVMTITTRMRLKCKPSHSAPRTLPKLLKASNQFESCLDNLMDRVHRDWECECQCNAQANLSIDFKLLREDNDFNNLVLFKPM